MPTNITTSIVILTYNNLDYTRQCLESIYAKTTEPSFEVVIVDNASQDGTPQYLNEFTQTHPNVRLILNETNQGFPRGNNIGAAAATGEFLVFLNNDVVVTQGWLSGLLHHLQDPTVGMVGPVTNSSGNESRIQVDYQDLEGMDDFARRYTHAHQGQAFEIDMLPFQCVALRRTVFQEVGPLDERFGTGMFEDDDYALRLKKGEYKILCAEDVFIHHWGSASFSKLRLSEYWYIFDINRKKFEEKWGVDWQPHLPRSELLRDQLRQMIDTTSWHVSLITEQTGQINRLETELAVKEARLQEIYGSNSWKIILFMQSLRLRLAPIGSYREKLFRSAGRKLVAFFSFLNKIWRRILPANWIGSFHMSWYAYAFDRFKRNRHALVAKRLDQVHCPTQPELVSIVLPVYNGADYLRESLDSVLHQTYQNFEIIVVDDGSTDNTPQILNEYAAHESRMRVIHQENQRLPRALSNGFCLAEGEYLTWTSADNRMKPDFLEKFVDCLHRHPDWDMVYANQDIIGENGHLLKNSEWYKWYQYPPGSGHVFLPPDPSELNLWPNNYVAGAFMYRDRVKYLLGDYSQWRFGTEDYDYWMRVNALMNLRHVDFKQPVYEYRFHGDSLTSQDEELGITSGRIRLMTFEDFRRDFYLSPIAWKIEASNEPNAKDYARQIQSWVAGAKHVLLNEANISPKEAPRLWFPAVYVKVVENPSASSSPDCDWTEAWRVLVVTSDIVLPEEIDPAWDACITTGTQQQLPRLGTPHQGWLSIPQPENLCTAIDIQARSSHLKKIEKEIEKPSHPTTEVSVVICTYHRGEKLWDSMVSVARQSFSSEDYELIVVNNDPADTAVDEMVAKLCASEFKDRLDKLRLVKCPFKGLSYARNAGISEARGEMISFLDDDAAAQPDWLLHLWNEYAENPGAGVVGGKILLDVPQPRPRWIKPGWEKFWSHFDPGYAQPTAVKHWWEFPWGANWSARRKALLEIGGFRANYGRRGSDFGGGEELVAAVLIQRLGYEIIVAPAAEVRHKPDSKRFTFKHVWRTILAGKNNEYNQQADLYLPMGLRFGWLARNILRNLVMAVFGKGLYSHQRFEYLIYAWAEARLVGRLIKDRLAKFRRPFVMERIN